MPRRIRGNQPRRKTYLREWREQRRLTLESAAADLDMSPAQLSRIETGKSPYTQDLLEHAAAVYKTDVASLLFRHPERADALWHALIKAAEQA